MGTNQIKSNLSISASCLALLPHTWRTSPTLLAILANRCCSWYVSLTLNSACSSRTLRSFSLANRAAPTRPSSSALSSACFAIFFSTFSCAFVIIKVTFLINYYARNKLANYFLEYK